MNPHSCHSLDDYLAHDLTGDERERFVAHLTDCQDCRRVVVEQQRIDALLKKALAPVPADLTQRIKRRLRHARRRRMAVVATALAASVVGVWLLSHAFHQPTKPEPSVAQALPVPEPPRLADEVRVTFPRADMLAVPQPTDSANVTILWVYPVLFSTPQSAPAADDRPASDERSEL